jgi:hypothetical protein
MEARLMVSNVSYRLSYIKAGWGLISVPVPTYFSIGKNTLPGSVQQKIGESGGEVTDNLVFLGQLATPCRVVVS